MVDFAFPRVGVVLKKRLLAFSLLLVVQDCGLKHDPLHLKLLSSELWPILVNEFP